jgi:hypothetical protein
LGDAASVPLSKRAIKGEVSTSAVAAAQYFLPSVPNGRGGFVLSREAVNGSARLALSIHCPFTKSVAVAVADICECSSAKVQAAPLCVDEFNWLDAWEICKVFHDETVSLPLWAHPCVRFQSNMAADIVKKFPSVGDMAGVNVEALCVSGLAKDWPGDSCLELEVINGDIQHAADFVILA